MPQGMMRACCRSRSNAARSMTLSGISGSQKRRRPAASLGSHASLPWHLHSLGARDSYSHDKSRRENENGFMGRLKAAKLQGP